MPRVKLTPSSKRARRRSYSPSALMRAYQAVKEDGVPVYRASRQYAVPLTTLRDRVDRRVPVDCTRSGPEQILSQLEESKLVAHIKRLAAVGYGYTRTDVLTMATDYAVRLGKRRDDYKCFSMQWFYNFMGRWPELRVVKPSSLSEVKARCASEESVTNYFEELDRILTRYNLKDKPQLIYNVDEKGVDTRYKPPNVVAGRGGRPQAVMAERIKSVSVIGAGNALGNRIPPFFVFPGQRMVPDLMRGKTAGADGVVTPTGWSNFQVFRDYMQDHFMKHVQCRDASDTILVLYDGHRSHVAIDLINWAKENDIVLFVLPPHRSHVLQPADVGCFWPLQLKYNQECLSFARANRRAVTRYDVCGLACKAYASALSPSNVQSAFARAGVYPFKPAEEVIKSLQPKLAPSTQHTTCRPNEQLHDASNLCSLHFGRKRYERDPTRLEPSGYFGTQARLRPEALPDASPLMPGRVSKLRPKAASLKGRMVEIVEDFLKSSDFNTGTESQLETSNSRSANIQVMVLSKVQGGVQSQQSQGSIRPIPAWLDTQGLTEESLQAAVTGLGIAILGALRAHTEPALTRVQLNSWSARKFTYTMHTELCRYMESFSAGQGSERTVVFGHVKDTEEVRAPAGVFQIKVED